MCYVITLSLWVASIQQTQLDTTFWVTFRIYSLNSTHTRWSANKQVKEKRKLMVTEERWWGKLNVPQKQKKRTKAKRKPPKRNPIPIPFFRVPPCVAKCESEYLSKVCVFCWTIRRKRSPVGWKNLVSRSNRGSKKAAPRANPEDRGHFAARTRVLFPRNREGAE